MKFLIFVILFTFCISSTNAQYYYSDIIGTRQTNEHYRLLRSFQTKKVNANSFDGNEPLKDFVLEQNVSNDGKRIITRSASIGNAESFFTSTYSDNKVIQTVDSGNNAINKVIYEYDNSEKVRSVSSFSKDFDGTFTSSELHLWTYDENGRTQTMHKIKNSTDTSFVYFKVDEDGNVAEETWKKNNRTLETYYYYYNEKKQLTDIVRYNRKAKNMIPDYMFEYDEKGHITQMTQTQNGSANYLVWKYKYNEKGMKEKEIVYNKKRELLGRIEYNYQ